MIYSHYIDKLEHLDGGNITLRADPLGTHGSFFPEPMDIVGSLLTAWRMLYTGLGYRELPISRVEARQLYLAAPDMQRMGTRYANVSNWRLRGYDYKGGRIFTSLETHPGAFALMGIPLICENKKN